MRLRDRQINRWKFRRQHPIGRFIVDFCCVEKKLIVELDGGQHVEQEERDQLRTEYLMALG
jgi:lysyl-tRNA synthetase class 2